MKSWAQDYFDNQMYEEDVRFKIFERYTSQDGKLKAEVVAILDSGRSAVFTLENAETAVVNFDFIRRGFWQRAYRDDQLRA